MAKVIGLGDFGSKDPLGLYKKATGLEPKSNAPKSSSSDIPDDYYASTSRSESGGNTQARNPRSSAQGEFQFLASTWEDMRRKHPELELTPEGRSDPEQQRRAMRAFTEDNAAVLRGRGLPIDGGTLYAAHFLGAGGAVKALSARDDTPMTALVSREVVEANPFLADMSAGQFRSWAARKGSGGAGGSSRSGNAPIVVGSDYRPSDPMALYPQRREEAPEEPSPLLDQPAEPPRRRVDMERYYQQLEQEQPGRYQLLDEDQAETFAADWQENHASKDILGDTWRLLGMGQTGLESSMRELVRQIPVVGPSLVEAGDNIDKWIYGKPSDERYAEQYERNAAELTPETQAAREKDWWDEDRGTFGSAWLDPRAYYAGVVESLPATVATMAPGMLLARGSFMSAVAGGASRQAASAAAARTALLSGAILEGGFGGADTARSVREQIAAMPREALLGTDAVKQLLGQGMTPDEAIAAVTNDAATQAFLVSGVATGMFGGLGDRALAKIIGEGVGGTIGKRLVAGATRGMVAEGLLEELPQSAAGQFAENMALGNTVDPGRNLGQGVANAALGGAATGAVMGGVLGGAGGAASPAAAVEPPMELPTAPAPVTPPAPAAPRGPLQTALEQGLTEAQSGAVDMSQMEDLTPPATGTVTMPLEPDMPTMPASYVGYPEPGKRVIVDNGELPRFVATVEAYVEEPQPDGSTQLEALVVDDTGEPLQVPAKDLHVGRPTKEMVEALEREQLGEKATDRKVDTDEARTRDVNGVRVVMPDETLAKLYDLGRERATSKTLFGASGLDMRETKVGGETELADALGVPLSRINEIADDYRYRVEKTARSPGAPDLPRNMYGLNAEKLKAWRAERDREALAPVDEPVQEELALPDVDAPPSAPVDVDGAAAAAATSPTNDLPEPTQAQKDAGNYKKGHVALGGLDLSIENPAGSERKGTDKGGKPWSVTMKSHYGYIRGTVGKDKDHIDVFVKKGTTELGENAPVFVVDQVVDGAFDEHKVMLGYSELPQAKRAYNANYTKGWKGLGNITATTLGELKQWLRSGDTSKPFAPAGDVQNVQTEQFAENAKSPAEDVVPAAPGVVEPDNSTAAVPAGSRRSADPKLAQPRDFVAPPKPQPTEPESEADLEIQLAAEGPWDFNDVYPLPKNGGDATTVSAEIEDVIQDVQVRELDISDGKAELTKLRNAVKPDADAIAALEKAIDEDRAGLRKIRSRLAERFSRAAVDAIMLEGEVRAARELKQRDPHVERPRIPKAERGTEAVAPAPTLPADYKAARDARWVMTLKGNKRRDPKDKTLQIHSFTITNPFTGEQTDIDVRTRIADDPLFGAVQNLAWQQFAGRSRAPVTEAPFPAKEPWAPADGETLVDSVRRFLVEDGKKTGKERVLAFHADGRLALDLVGSDNFVAIKGENRKVLEAPANEIVLHHNHPSSRPLSPMDLAMLALPGLRAVWAHGHAGGSHRASLTSLGRKQLADVPGEVGLRIRDLKKGFELLPPLDRAIQALIDSKQVTVDEANAAWLVVVGNIWQDAGLLDFSSDTPIPPAMRDDAKVQQFAAEFTKALRERYGKDPVDGGRAGPVRHAADVAKAPGAAAPATPADGAPPRADRKGGKRGGGEAREVVAPPAPDTPPPPAPAAEAPAAAPQQFAKNKLFTADKVDAARARLRAKMGQLNSGIDPDVLVDGMTIAGAYIEAGVRDFAEYAQAMTGDFGDAIKPYLLSFWEGARNYPGLDTKGMTSPEESARLHADLNKVLPVEAAPALGQELAPPKKRAKKAGGAGDRTLIQDFGVEHIDGWAGEGEETDFGIKGGVKDNFIKDAMSYLRAVSDILEKEGFTPPTDTRGRARKAVNKNESGVATSGDVSLNLWHPETDARIYVHIAGTALRGSVPTTKSGISIMFRTGFGTDADVIRAMNQWAPVDLSATDFAALLRGAVERAGLWAKRNRSQEEQQRVIEELKAVVARPSLTPERELFDEPQELDQPGPGALEGAPSDAVPPAAGSGDTGTQPQGGGGADVPRGERARGQRVPAGRSVADGAGEVSPAAPRGNADADRAAEPDAPGDRGDERRPARDAARVDQSPGPSGAVPAGNRATEFVITDEDEIGAGGAKTKFRNNVAAIKLLRQLEEEKRRATRSEQAVLAKWVGWGGLSAAFPREDGSVVKGWEKQAAELKDLLTPEEYRAAASSTRNAHYTSPEVVKAIWSIVERLGFRGGKVLEPSIGAGNFIGLMPSQLRDASQIIGVELDHITGGIAKHLYPKADINAPVGYQDFAVPDGYFDLAIGNPPFGSEKLYDKDRRAISGLSIHNYFFAKSIDALRPGGVLAMVVTNYWLDAPHSAGRQYVADKADLIGAIRLPNTAFLQNAGTEVTTDLIFLRKRAPGEAPSEFTWKSTGTFTDKNGKAVNLSRYFLDHPDMMLGEFGAYGTMYRADTAALVAREGQDLEADLAAAIAKLPRDLITSAGAPVAPETVTVATDVEDAVVGSMFLTPESKVMIRRPDSLGKTQAEPVEFANEKAAQRVAGMIRVRDVFARLRRAQIDESATDKQIETLRERLNKVYDTFVSQNGPINADANRRLFRDDPTWPQISALEEKFDKGVSDTIAKRTGETARPPSAQKAPIFTRRTQQPYRPPSTASSAKDALAAVLSDLGRVDLSAMGRLYGKPDEAIVAELGSLLYRTPAGSYVTADDYLSGNVKAKLAEARTAAAKDRSFERNVAALESVIPADIEAVDIDVKPGAPWIPPAHVGAFLDHITESKGGRAAYVRSAATWTAHPARPSAAAQAQWSTDRATVEAVLDAVLNGRSLSIYDRMSDGKSILNQEATQAANDKVERVKAEWRRWIWQHDARREELARLYNDIFNTSVVRRFDGSHLSFPGKVGDDIISLRPHQKAFIWRGMQTSTVLADHTVGAGKTFALIALAMEMRRIGLARKPMFVVPNHLVGQWAADFIKLYPGAKVLATTKADFEKENRKRLFARVATGDWDAVIVAHSSFGKVPVDPKFERQFIQQQIDDLEVSASELREAEGGKSRTVKQLEKARANMEARLKILLDAGSKDVGMTFEEIGVDALFVDEAHEFKNLGFATKMTRVAGLGNTQGSQKAADLFMKVTSVLERTGGRNIVFATGTPLSNTMAEMYTVQRYLDYKALREMGIAHFDAWARVFGEVVTDWELSPSGTYKLNSRFAKFVNMPELMQRYLSFADVITNDDIKRQLAAIGKTLPLPKVKGGKPTNIVVERSADQAAFIGVPTKGQNGEDQYPKGSLVWRAENLPKKVEKGSDNMLKVMSDARKAALDMRLIDPNYGDVPGSKVHIAADNIRRLYDRWHKQRGTQLVFIDLSTPKGARAAEEARVRDLMQKADDGDEAAIEALDRMSPDELLSLSSSFSVYDDLREKLIARGVPAAEIAFIHDANTEAQKEELFAKVRSGRVRVLFGSTPKMGAGTNVQNRLVALHHLDAPWRPSDLEQRDGRGIRQGNELYAEDPEGFEIEILRYATKNTLDARQWQTIEGKARFIAQVRKGDVGARVIEDIAGEAANAAEMKAAASGNPLILEEMDLRQKVRRLEGQSAEHDREQHRIRGSIRRLTQDAKEAREALPAEQEEATLAAEAIESGFPATVNATQVEKPGQLGAAIAAAAKRLLADKVQVPTTIGSFGGFKLMLEHAPAFDAPNRFVLNVVGNSAHSLRIGDVEDVSDVGLGVSTLNLIRGLVGNPEQTEKRIVQIETDLPGLEKQLGAWPEAQQLADLKARHAEILAKLQPKREPGTATAPATAEPSLPEDAITLRGDELGAGRDLRRAALRWYTDNLVGEAVKTADGVTVLFNQLGAKEATLGSRNEFALKAIPALRHIIERGQVLRREKPGTPKADTTRESIGDRLTAVREAQGITAAAMASELGLSPQRYGSYERGRSLVPPEVLDNLWRQTGATADYILFGRTSGMPKHLLDRMRGQGPEGVKERIIIAAPVRIGDETRTLAVTVNATPDGRFAYDLTVVPDRAPGGADFSAGDADADDLNLLEVPEGWGDVGGAETRTISDEDRVELTSIVQQVSGLDDVTFHRRIELPNGAPGWGKNAPTTAAGYYDPVADLIALADDSATARTAYHEAFHRVQRLFLTAREKEVLAAETGRLRRIVASNEFRREQVKGMSQKELEAEAFALYATGQSTVKPHVALRSLWDRIAAAVRRVLNWAAGRGFQVSEDIFDRAAGGDMAARAAAAASQGVRQFQIAWHGSPHRFDQFSLGKIGTGEGSQAFGHGLYFAGNREVAESYRKALSSAIIDFDGRDITAATDLPAHARTARNFILGRGSVDNALTAIDETIAGETVERMKNFYQAARNWLAENRSRISAREGQLYQVQIPDDAELLDWDRPLSEQPPSVQKAIAAIAKKLGDQRGTTFQRLSAAENLRNQYLSGETIYRGITTILGSPAAASKALRDAGVPGLRYLDALSRGKADARTHNYVVFDDQRVGIEGREYSLPETPVQPLTVDRQFPRPKGPRVGRPAKVTVESITTELKGRLTDMQPALLKLIPLNYFSELAQPNMSAVNDYLRTKREMDAYRGKKHAEADAVAQEWLKYMRLGFGVVPSKEGKAAAAELAGLMHDATLAGVDPAATDDETVRKAGYDVLRARYLRLPKAGQLLFKRVRDAYLDQANELDKLLLEAVRKAQQIARNRAQERYEEELARIDAAELDDDERRKATEDAHSAFAHQSLRSQYASKGRLTRMRIAFEKNRVPAPYFPLARFGRYFVTVKNAKGEVISFSRREKAADRDRLATDMRKAFPDAKVEVGVLDGAGGGVREFMDPRLVAEVEEILGGAGVDGSVMDQIWQRYLETMPDLSTRKRFIHRKGTQGFDQDALRAFSNHMFHAAHQMGRIKFGLDLQELTDQVTNQAKKAPDVTKGMTLANQLKQHHDWVMNPTGSRFAQTMTSTAFVWLLAASPAAALVNMTQTPMLGIPIIGAKFGTAKTAAALMRASRDTFNGAGSVTKAKLSEEEKWAIERFYESGLIDRTQAHDLAGVGETGVEYSPLRAKVMGVMSWMFHRAEVWNREVTALAAFRIARESGQSAFAALDTAHDLTWKVHFDYSNASRPALMQNDIAKVALVFRNHSINMLYRIIRDTRQAFKGETAQIRKEARYQLAGILGMQALIGGVKGIFAFNVVMTLLGLAFGGDDEPMDMEQQFTKFVLDALGPELGGIVLNGAPGHYLKIDLTARVGMPDIWFRAPNRELEGQAEFQHWVMESLGASVGMMGDWWFGMDMAGQGKWDRAFEAFAPKGLRDIFKAGRFLANGVTSLAGDPLLEKGEIDPWTVLSQAIGFTPAKVAETYERNNALKNAEKRITNARRELLNQMAAAIMLEDDDAQKRVIADIEKFNAVEAHAPVAITRDTIKRSLRTRASNAAKREDGVLIQNEGLGHVLRDALAPTVYR